MAGPGCTVVVGGAYLVTEEVSMKLRLCTFTVCSAYFLSGGTRLEAG